jgi:hypothetical protein
MADRKGWSDLIGDNPKKWKFWKTAQKFGRIITARTVEVLFFILIRRGDLLELKSNVEEKGARHF